MAMNKIANVSLDINPYYNELKKMNVEFYNQDINTSKLRFQVTRNNAPMLLSEINANAQIVLVPSNGSKKVDNLVFEDEMNGILSYTLPNDVLTHVGKVTGEIYINRKGTEDTVVVNTFDFTIKDAIINTISADTKLSYIRKFDDLEALIKERVVEIQKSIAGLEDYVTKVNNAKDDALQAIGVEKENVELIIETGKNDLEVLLNNDTFLKVEDFNEYKTNIDQQMTSFNNSLEEKTSDKVKQSDFDALNWQEYKLTEEDGGRIYKPNIEDIDITTFPSGFYEITTTNQTDWDLCRLPNFQDMRIGHIASLDVTTSRNGRKQFIYRHNHYNRIFVSTLHTNGEWREWKELTQTSNDSGWVRFNLLNGAYTDTEYQDKNGFSCSYRTIDNGLVKNHHLRLNGSNFTDGQTIGKIPSSMVKYAQTFPVRTPTNHLVSYITIYTDGSIVFLLNKNANAAQWIKTDYVYGEFSWIE